MEQRRFSRSFYMIVVGSLPMSTYIFAKGTENLISVQSQTGL